MVKNRTLGLAAILALGGLAGCNGDSGGGAPAPPKGSGAAPAPAPAGPATGPAAAPAPSGAGNPNAIPADDVLLEKYRGRLDLPMVRYEWDPKAGDPSVSAEMGGPGFTGEGWETCLEFPTTARIDAPKGGTLRTVMYDWPATLRVAGENNNSTFNSMVETLCLDYLVGFDSVSMQFVPSLATHWKISADKQTYSFRINPEAKWNDGTPVTADDVVATWKLRTDPKCRFPSDVMTFNKFDCPVALSKYVVEVHCKDENWRNFIYFGAGMGIMPAADISIPGDVYLDRFQNRYHLMSGPYTVLLEDVKMGDSVALTRRTDWWGAKNPANAGSANIDKIIFQVVKDPNLAYEKVKNGEIDFWVPPRALWWATEIPHLDLVKRGILVMKKIYNDCPIGINGLAINMLRPPLDDIRVRKALQLLFNNDLMIEKLCYNEYVPLSSFHQGGLYANPANEPTRYDPREAVRLLKEAGWTETNRELYRVKNGREMKLEVLYVYDSSEKFLTPFQEDCRKAGIRIELKRLTESAHFKAVHNKEFDLADQGWTGLFFPNPETSFNSALADQKDNNNIMGFKDKRVDELCLEYDHCYDAARRVEIIREIDGLVYAEQPYVLMWFNPSQRFLIKNKFGMPPWGAGRITRVDQVWFSFWVDPAKEKALAAAEKDSSVKLEVEEQKNFFWPAWNALKRAGEPKGKDR